ncbi:MAG: Gfo/Idh/MocA family oxidoreductase [Dehalococcoidia bacterium]|nr:Gfo/Idh/MocA family oxidoreductase [Dehalococcoidia bacterium]
MESIEQGVLKGGIVGCGGAASIYHMPAFRNLKGIRIVAACDRREQAALETARRFGIPRTYGDISQMLEREKLNFVDICSPPQTHFQVCMEAMEAGLHVLVEKPMAFSVSEADKMVSVSRKNEVKLCVIHNLLFTPVVQKAKHLVDSGAIGDLTGVEVKILSRGDGAISKEEHWCHCLPGGIFGEFAPHALYLASAFLGTINSARAIAMKHSSFPWVIADELKVMLEAENGLGAFTISCNSPRPSLTMDIFGTKRVLHLNNFAMTLIQHESGSYRIPDLLFDELKSGLRLTTGAVSSMLRVASSRRWYEIGHRVLIRKFLESVTGNMDPPVTGEDGRETLRILEDICRQVNIPNSAPGQKE